jgi:hypothetical protein
MKQLLHITASGHQNLPTARLIRLFISLLLCISTSVHLRSQTWQWGQTGGGSNDDYGSSLANENVYKIGSDAKGNVYVAWVGFGL